MFTRPTKLSVILLLTLVLLLSPSPIHALSVSQQFNLSPKKNGHVSACWVTCHQAVTANVPINWGKGGVEGVGSDGQTTENAVSYITRNCKYDLYLKVMADCFPVYCASSWDVEYAVEYGMNVCEKGGVKNVTFPVAASYTSTAGGYFATGVLAASSSAAPRMSAIWPVVAGLGAVVCGVFGGVAAVL